MNQGLKEPDAYGLGDLAGPVEAAAERIDAKVGEAAKTLYEIGAELREVKPLLRGKWGTWVDGRIGMSVDKADKLIAASVKIDANPKLRELLGVRYDKSIFNLLTAPGTPQDAIDKVVGIIDDGELPTLDEVKEIVKDAKTPQAAESWTCPNCGGQERDAEACKACHEPLTPPARDHQRDFAEDAPAACDSSALRRLRKTVEIACGIAVNATTSVHGELLRSEKEAVDLACKIIREELIGRLKQYAKGDGE